MKKGIAVFLLMCSLYVYSQENSRHSYLKANLLFLPVGVINVGAEFQISNKNTIQADVLASPWRSIKGEHAQIYLGTLEARHYFQEAFNGFYAGINAGGGYYNATKWDHWNMNQYQVGYTIVAGATVGYQMKISEAWNLDFFLGGGMMQSLYRGYRKLPAGEGRVVRYDGAQGLNKSGELLPYKGGIMISYKLK